VRKAEGTFWSSNGDTGRSTVLPQHGEAYSFGSWQEVYTPYFTPAASYSSPTNGAMFGIYRSKPDEFARSRMRVARTSAASLTDTTYRQAQCIAERNQLDMLEEDIV